MAATSGRATPASGSTLHSPWDPVHGPTATLAGSEQEEALQERRNLATNAQTLASRRSGIPATPVGDDLVGDSGGIQEKQCLDHGEVVDKLAQRQQGDCTNDRVFQKDDGNASLALQ